MSINKISNNVSFKGVYYANPSNDKKHLSGLQRINKSNKLNFEYVLII